MKNNFLFWRMFRGGDTGDMDIDSDSFIETLARSNYPGPDDDSEIEQPEEPKEVKPHWWEFRYLKGFRFLAIAGVGLMMLTIVITYSIIFVNDVILFENQIHINDQGAFNPHKSMNCEYGLYLFNTADVWANSGIQVSKGDRIKVNVSGGFQSSVENIIRFADDNKELKYRWVYYNNEGGKEVDSADRSALPYCLFRYGGKVDAHNRDYKELPMAFGAAMIGIFPESENLGGNPIIDDKDRAERVWECTKS